MKKQNWEIICGKNTPRATHESINVKCVDFGIGIVVRKSTVQTFPEQLS